MEKFKIRGIHVFHGKELLLEGMLELVSPGYFIGKISGHKGLLDYVTGKSKLLNIEGTISNCSKFRESKSEDLTVLNLTVHQPNDGRVWYSPSYYELSKPVSVDDKGVVINGRTIASIPDTNFIPGEYSGKWYQDIMLYDGPGSRAKGRPNTGSGGYGIAKIALTRA